MSALTKEVYNIGDALENFYSLTPAQQTTVLNDLAAVGTPIGESGTLTMYTGEEIYKFLILEYSEFNFFSSTLLYNGSTFALAGRWKDWMNATGNSWANAFTTLYNKEYDPIHNYDGSETETITVTHTGTDTDERTPDLTVENTPNTVDESGIYGANSSSAVNRERNTKTGTDTTTTAGTDTTEHTYESELATVRELTKGGNLGVTTTQQMIAAELELRKKNLLRTIVREFVFENCFIC